MLSKRVRMKRVLTLTRYLFDPQLSWRKIFGHVIPRSREKTCLSSKFYAILNVIPSDIEVRSLMNSEKRLMVKSTVAHRGHAIHFLNSIYRAIFCNGNCTEWSAIWVEITSMISDQNCTTRGSITTLLHPFWNRPNTGLDQFKYFLLMRYWAGLKLNSCPFFGGKSKS